MSSHRITYCILFLESHIISVSLYPFLTNKIISSPQINTHWLHRNAHSLFSDKHNKSFSEKRHGYTKYIIFTDRHTVSSFQIYNLNLSHRNTYILFSSKHTISTSQINTIYPLYGNARYILFQVNSLYHLLRNKDHILFSDKQ